MIPNMLPRDASVRAVSIGISFVMAVTNAISELNGKIVAAKKAAINRASCAI